MLTRKSSTASKAKMLVFVPLTLACVLCFSKNSFSQKPKVNGNYASYRGNRIELSKSRIDTFEIQDPVTGKWDTKMVEQAPKAIKLNNEKIFAENETDAKPVPVKGKQEFENYILVSMNKIANELPDGEYGLNLTNIVIDKDGKVAYYENRGLIQYQPDPKAQFGMKQNPITRLKVMEALDEMMENMPEFTPARNDLKAVPYRLPMLLPKKTIQVHDHRIIIVDAM